MRTRIAVCVLLISSLLLPLNSAEAAWTQYQTSPADTYNRSDIPPEYDITRVDFAVSDAFPDEYMFFINFAKPVTSNLFADGKGSWAGILLDTNNDGKDDYSLETDLTPYVGTYGKPGKFVDRTSNNPVNSTQCNTITWTSLEANVNWIGFKIKKNCLSLNATIGVRGFNDHISADDAEFDYAPETPWLMSPTGGNITPSGNASSTTIVGQLPSVNSAGESLVNAPSNQPGDLVALAAETTKSVVTVLCGSGLGSGWAVNADLSSANITNGYKSYVITNHHVIANCTTNRNITLVLSNQTRVSAYVYAWDETNDVAGILTSTVIPPLNWRGATPQQGWWVGVIGSPLGFPGILTSGIVSSVNSGTFLGTTNAAINPGNSGGPVFDRTGRVIGLATAKYVNSEGFGIFNGVPLLCQKILVCASNSQIWQGVTAPTPTPTPSASVNSLVISASNRVYEAIDKVDAAVVDCNDLLLSKGDELATFINSTIYGGACDSLNQKIETVKANFTSTGTTGSDTAGLVSKLDNFTSNLATYYKSVIEVTNDLESSLKIFSDLSMRMTAAQDVSSNARDSFASFSAKLKLLPVTLQSTIRKKTQYPQIINGLNLERKYDAALEIQNAASSSISDKQSLIAFSATFKVFETRYKDFISISANIEELDLLIPDYVCIKGKSSVLLPKSGKCAKGYVKTPTFEDA